MPNNIYWPDGLPYLNTGWSMQVEDNILRSTPERGPAKTRRKSTAKTKTYKGTLTLSSTQLDIFLSFVEDTIADGALSFIFPDWLDKNGSKGEVLKHSRLISHAVTQESPNRYSVDVEIEVLP